MDDGKNANSNMLNNWLLPGRKVHSEVSSTAKGRTCYIPDGYNSGHYYIKPDNQSVDDGLGELQECERTDDGITPKL